MKYSSLSLLPALCLFSSVATLAQDPAALRLKAMEQTRQEIQRKLAAEGGEWQSWFAQLQPLREDLFRKFHETAKDVRVPPGKPQAHPWSYLKAEGNPPLFAQNASSLYIFANNESADTYIHAKLTEDTPAAFTNLTRFAAIPTIKSFAKWLKDRNVDLVFVPVPKMVEVYANRVVKNVPEDRIVAPHMRKVMLDLLDQDIEVVDLLPAFLKAAGADPDPLFLPADSHWIGPAEQIAANLIAERLKRYSFVRTALSKPKRFRTSQVPWTFEGYDFPYLTKTEQQEVVSTYKKKPLTRVSNLDGTVFEEPDDAPILVIGDSYTAYTSGSIVKGAGIDALLANAVNLPVSNISTGGSTTQAIMDLVRNPQLLKVHKVVVWILTMDNFTFPLGWDLKLPDSTVPASATPFHAPSVVSGLPTAARASPQTFTLTGRDKDGYADINQMFFMVGEEGKPTCHGFYDQPRHAFFLWEDVAKAWIGPLGPTPSSTLETKSCVLYGSSSVVSSSGNDLVVNFTLGMSGDLANEERNVYFMVRDNERKDSPWTKTGTWSAVK